ncbi:family 78 glycoside hydrolase catalytic domain [Demequina sediminicola]|uniref:family 78 glycoside hydrolase catalytic domain n=1 Tax=Demequina sediminicola TaxID=1095026 RepID=UPI00137923BD|nr:family 78 glycoside hydrolase catalytic domain [Demequina sediminicola]
MAFLLLATSWALGGAAPAAHAAPDAQSSPSGLRINGLEQPADLNDLEEPAFSWFVNTSTQTAYQIRVSSTAQNAADGVADVWDSGKIASTAQTDVPYGGEPLDTATRYFWTVTTWDSADAESAPSETAWFGTELGSDWNAVPVWVAPPVVDDSGPWTDYTLDTTITVEDVALGIFVRGVDDKNAYMWQFRADTNQLVPHLLQNGKYTALAPVALPEGAISEDVPVDIQIKVAGSTIITSVAGVQVDERTDASFASGEVGFRTGRSETGTVSALTVTDASGESLYSFDPTEATHFDCADISEGALHVGTSASCLYALPGSGASATDWAFIRTELELPDKAITGATLFATASDFRAHSQFAFKAYVNGAFVGLGPTNRIGNENRYDGFDVTEFLNQGAANAIAVQAYAADDSLQKFIGELVVTYADGTTQSFGTDETWKASSGALALPDAGSLSSSWYTAPKENLDLREFPTGYTSTGFDDSEWSPAIVKDNFADLQATPIAKVEQQLHEPVEIVDKGDGNYFVDFGRTWIGGVNYDISEGEAGDTVELRFGEITSAENTVKYKLTTNTTEYRDVATLRDGDQTIETWGMRVFRYLEIIDAPEPVTADNLQALALVYPFDDEASAFTSSDDNLNQVYDFSKNTIESVNVNFYTDSWTRERINYEADGYLQLMSSLYLMEDLSLGRYSMDYFSNNRTWPTEWPIYVVLAVHDAWQQTGNLEQVEAAYDTLVDKLPTKWIDPETGLVRKTSGSNGCASRTDCDIVDWPTSQRDNYEFREYNTVLNALSYRSLIDMAAMAEALGLDEDAATYTAQAERMRDSMNALLFDEENGRYDDGMDASHTPTGHASLHASAFSLAFGVPEQDQAARVADYVASKGMACSVYCAGFSISGLFDGGAADAAVDLLTDEGTSSWMNMINLGAGSTMEAWDPSQKNNLTYSHPWAASPAFHVPAGLFGIEPIEAGYETFQIKPQPGGVDEARITVPTVKGQVGAAFNHDAQGTIRLAAQIPGNTTADLLIPVPEGTESVFMNGVEIDVDVTDGYATLSNVGAGCQVVAVNHDATISSDEFLSALCEPVLVEDDTAPIVNGLTSGTIYADSALHLAVTAEDEESGIRSLDVTFNGESVEADATISPEQLSSLVGGEVPLTASATNGAGLVTEESTTVFVLPFADDAAAPPSRAQLSNTSGWIYGLRDGNFDVQMNLWWGTPGTVFNLYENGALIHTQVLEEGPGNSQSAIVALEGRPNGTYEYTGELVNSKGTTATTKTTVEVTSAAPGRPSVSHDNWAKEPSFTATANLWWGTNATSYRFELDGEVVATGELTAATPRAQRASVDLTDVPAGEHEIVAVFVNANGETASHAVTVEVD